MDTYILNGVEVSAEQLASYARAAGISLEQFKEDNGVTVKSSDKVKEEETFYDWEGKQIVAAAGDVAVATEVDETSALESKLEDILLE